ncbi:MAG: hypothetical protein WC700_10445 [Gemmatimonadaceae bacterium]|jgi:hypothetical protein
MLSLEQLLTSADGFGLSTASPVQRAICRVVDGMSLGDLATLPAVERLLGGASGVDAWEHVAPGRPPREVYLIAGIRTGKSLLAAAIAVRAALSCDVSQLRAGEVPRSSVVSLTRDLARVVHGHVAGSMAGSPALRNTLVGEPTAEMVLVRHPSGREVEIAIVAGARAGSSVVARWSTGLVADEFPRMLGQDEGVANFDELRKACLGRLLPGAQIVAIGSPWAPYGPAFDVSQEHFERPTADRVVLRSSGPDMHPVYWHPGRCEALRVADPDAYRTDVEGEFGASASGQYAPDLVRAAVRDAPADLPAVDGHHYVAAIDPATRGNAWALVVMTKERRSEGGRRRVVLAREWLGSSVAPLSPSVVLQEIAALLAPYRVRVVATDQWAADALRDVGLPLGVSLQQVTLTQPWALDIHDTIRLDMTAGALELAPGHIPDDLVRVKRRLTRNGVAIELPHTADGRHCDSAAALALCYALPLQAADEQPTANQQIARAGWEPNELRAAQAMARRMRERKAGGL